MPELGASAILHEPVALRRVRLVVAYNGAGFHGFARNAGMRTVAGELTDVLSTIVRNPVELVGAGRTDAGVHAWGQVVSADLPAHLDLQNVAHRVNRMCGPELVIRHAQWADDGFNARFSALWRQYRYTIWNESVPNPFLTDTAWHVHRPLQLELMRLACDPLMGERDFTSFCRRPPSVAGQPEPSLHRRVMVARWVDASGELGVAQGRLLRFEIRANAFCHQMVRAIVGTLVQVGVGTLHAGEMRAIMAARSRDAAATLAPPHGLSLWEVGYPD